jgi:hypothetical protein
MTWIVGTVPPFGYSILASDIRVSWANGTERDCLQKIYALHDDFMGGFAGSVLLGFKTLGAIAEQLPSKQHLGPPLIAKNWIPRLARRVFRNASPEDRRLGCQIIVAAVHPTQTLGDVSWPRTYVWTFSHPNFQPREARIGEVVGIGSGSAVPSYSDALRGACDPSFIYQMAPSGAGMLANLVARAMHKAVARIPTNGVSPFMQMGIVTRGQTLVGDFRSSEYRPDGAQIDIRPPPVAQSYHEFSEYCRRQTLTASCAVC